MLRLSLVPGLGPVRGRRLLEHFGGLGAMLRASPSELRRVEGIGEKLSAAITAGLRESERLAEQEIARCEGVGAPGVRLVALGDAEYPVLLREVRDAPLVLYVRGDPACLARAYAVGIVGSRSCTAYGVEQAERFAGFLASAGLTVVSGGARGIDSAAHRASVRAGGKTAAVLGCGLSHCYPPENAELFEQMIAGGGAVVSELPMDTAPSAENFPARNRVICGLSLGVLVIEAPRGSGALITARCALEEYGREVLAVPGRIDSTASEGSNELIKKGEAAMATAPGDVLDALESAARHQWGGTHEARYAGGGGVGDEADRVDAGDGHGLFAAVGGAPLVRNGSGEAGKPVSAVSLTDRQRVIVGSLASALTFDELVRATGLDAGVIQGELTLLELRRVIRREGSRFARRA